jgi:DTW domain-containing protein YfiP
VVQVATATRLVVVRHTLEAFKSTNSVRWAALALPNLEIHPFGGRGDFDPAPLEGAGAWLLFPGGEATPAAAAPPARLIVLDGTWRQVRRMYRGIKPLHAMPRLSLSDVRARGPRLRQNPRAHHLSTLEAIASAIERLEGQEKAASLWTMYERMVDGTRRGRGRVSQLFS